MERKRKAAGFSKPARKRQRTYPYGNYNRYYGYRAPKHDDPRLTAMNEEWFNDKSVLDIGCNAGIVTRWIAASYKPWRVVGIDIDSRLVGNARNSLQKWIAKDLALQQRQLPDPNEENTPNSSDDAIYQPDHQFPNNITFKTANFISDDFHDSQKFDVIMCLSVAKWIHLNWGDEGLMTLFKKSFSMLEPGGRFILEPQPWDSYRKKHKITEAIRETFHAIKIKPKQFVDILLSDEVGFASCSELTINYPENFAEGFSKRPVYILTKPETKQPVGNE